MASYFDHFIVTKVLTSYITDSFFIFFFVLILYSITCKKILIVPTKFQSVFEIIIDHWTTVVKENLGQRTDFYIYPLSTLFMFLLGINLLGFFVFTFPSTTHISLTFGLSLIIWISVMFLGFKNFKLSFFSMFMPTGAPLLLSPLLVAIEIVSNISRPIALGMRLAANLTAGHILLAILSDFGCKLLFYSWGVAGLFPIFIIIFMTLLEIAVLFIQAYVFTLLSLIYLRDSLILH